MKRRHFQPGDLVRCVATQRQGLVVGFTHRKYNVVWMGDIKHFLGSWGTFLTQGYSPKRLKKITSLTDEELLTHESKYVRALYIAPGKRQWLHRVKHVDNYEFNWSFLPEGVHLGLDSTDKLSLPTSEGKTSALSTRALRQTHLTVTHWRTQVD